MNTKSSLLKSILALPIIILTTLSATVSQAVTHEEYIEECEKEIGLQVPAFNCLDGEPMPGQSHNANYPDADHINLDDLYMSNSSGPCEITGFFNQGERCAPARVQLLEDDGDAFTVALCRKDNASFGNYNDIAIIQTRRSTGATCFFQKRTSTISAEVPAPRDSHTSSWRDPDFVTGFCTGCHESDAIIRSPGIAKTVYDGKKINSVQADPRGTNKTVHWSLNAAENNLVEQPVLPENINSPNNPYWIVGLHPSKVVQPVSLNSSNNHCTTCHDLGTQLESNGDDIYNAPHYFQTGMLRYAYMSVFHLSELQFNGFYGALDNTQNKWWMPPARASFSTDSNGNYLSPFPYYYSYSDLELCKREFLEANDGRHSSQGIVYPDTDNCQVQPKPKAHNLDTGQTLTIRINDSGDHLTSDHPSSLYLSNTQNQNQWRFTRIENDLFSIMNANGGVLCLNLNNMVPGLCSSTNISNFAYEWKLNVFNDYQNHGGIPSGRTFKIESGLVSGLFYGMTGSGSLTMLPGAHNGLVWRIE